MFGHFRLVNMKLAFSCWAATVCLTNLVVESHVSTQQPSTDVQIVDFSGPISLCIDAGNDDAIVDVPRVDVNAASVQVLRCVLARQRGVADHGALR